MMSSGSSPVREPATVREIRQFRTSTELEKFLFSEDLCLILQKLLRYDYEAVIAMAGGELKEACQNELRRLQGLKLKEKIPRNLYLDNELAANAILSQVRAMAELLKANQDALRRLGSPAKGKSGGEQKQDVVARRYAEIEEEIQKSEGVVRQFMENEVLSRQEVDLQTCIAFFKRQARRLRRSSGEKMVLSRAHLLDALSYCLKQASRLIHPEEQESEQQAQEEPSSDSNDVEQKQQQTDSDKGQLSYQQINRWRHLSSGAVQGKLSELASVCQQIPQLQAFNRTMQFSQLENRQRVVFLRVVDVLISLHHRVSYLSRNKPQLLRELEQAQEELGCLNTACESFLNQLEQEVAEIAPLCFSAEVKKHNQLSEPFLQLRRKLIKMGEVIVSQDHFHTQGFHRADRLAHLLHLYILAFGGQEGEWQQLVQSLGVEEEGVPEGVSEEEYQLVMQLQDCLLEYQGKLVFIQQLEQQSTTKTNEELEDEVNKLISDYERLKVENKQHLDSLQLLARVREQLELEIEQRDNMIYNLSGLKVALEKRLANVEAPAHSSRALQDELKKQQRETQRYLESSLLLREQLKVSESEREKLLLLVEGEKDKYLKLFQSSSRLKPQKERLQRENQQLQERIQKMKNDQQRQLSKLSKQVNDITNQRDLLQQELNTAEANKSKLLDRLQASEKRMVDYSKLVINRVEERDHKAEQSDRARLEDEIERSRREGDRSRKELESRRVEMDVLERECANYQLEISSLKAKLKETRAGQEEAQEKEDLIRDLKAKFDKANNRATALNRELAESREEEEQAAARNRTLSKRNKDLQTALADAEAQSERLTQQLQQRNNQIGDIQKTINAQAAQHNTEASQLRERLQREEREVQQKGTRIAALERKVQRLEGELAAKRSQGQETARQLVDVKVRQYQTTIQTHRLIEVKLEEQARSLKAQLQEKVEVELKLNLEIDRLSKEIDRMKQQLQRFLRELTEKELVIKQERERYEDQVRIIREYDVKEKIQQEAHTPIRPYSHHKRDDDTPSHIQDRRQEPNDPNNDSILSKSNVKYDLYFNAKEYDRLQKEYNEFRSTVGQRLDELQRNLQQARRAKVDLEIKCSNLAAENKRIITSKTINGSGSVSGNSNSSIDGDKKKNDSLEVKLQEANSLVVQYQNNITALNDNIALLQERLRSKEEETEAARRHNSDEEALRKEIDRLTQRIGELQSKTNQLEKAKNDLDSKNQEYAKQLKLAQESNRKVDKLQQQLKQAQNTIANQTNNASNNAETDKLKLVIQQLNEQIAKLQQQLKNHSQNSLSTSKAETLAKERDQAAKEMDQNVKDKEQLLKEKDFLLRQQDDLRHRLADESKKNMNLQAVLNKLHEQLKAAQRLSTQLAGAKLRANELEIQLEAARGERRGGERSTGDIEYYLQKIRSLEEALVAVGDELSDSKQALYRERSKEKGSPREYQLMFEDNQRLWNDNHLLLQGNQQLSLQLEGFMRRETEWTAKERLYLQELEFLSRENVSLKDLASKPSDKQITTHLPPRNNPINTNYQEGEDGRRGQNSQQILKQMDAAIQGRARWQSARLLESLQRWRVPLIVCKEIEDLLTYVGQVVELIKFLRADFTNLRSSGSDSVLLENLLELIFRVLVYFSEIPFGSTEAAKMKAQLQDTGRKYRGGILFTVLEEFTIHILENNAIEEYKRELRTKAMELLQIKEKLDQLITRQIEQQEKIVNRPQSHRSRDTTPYKESLNASPKPVK